MDSRDPLSPGSVGLKLMIMNTGGENTGEEPTERRKQAIFDVISKTKADLYLLQEFRWNGIRSRAWQKFDWPKNFDYVGHDHASIISNINEVSCKAVLQCVLEGTLHQLVITAKIENGFAPFSRMCVRLVETKGDTQDAFLCISWHGRHNKLKYDDLRNEFQYLMAYVVELSEKQELPVLIAGDFNIQLKDVEEYIPTSLKLHSSKTKRRPKKNGIDFYICSNSLILKDVQELKFERNTNVKDVYSLFDHDPIGALLFTKPHHFDTDSESSILTKIKELKLD